MDNLHFNINRVSYINLFYNKIVSFFFSEMWDTFNNVFFKKK